MFLKPVFDSPCFGVVFLQKGFVCVFVFLCLAFFCYMHKKMVSFLKDSFFHDNVQLHFLKA